MRKNGFNQWHLNVRKKQVASLCLWCMTGVALGFPTDALAAVSGTMRADAVQQQERRIRGVVKDTNGDPLMGAYVRIPGTNKLTVTDAKGEFSLLISGNTIEVTYVGFVKRAVKIDPNQQLVNVVLEEDNKSLSEAVVVGYGTQKKANLSGSVAQITAQELADRPVQNVSSALQGLMSGVTITAGQGRPGQDESTIRIRGVGTLNTADPYILIDGVEAGTINAIDPNDIENISVLKDASSAAIYGSKASNGVILITTKRGKSGKPKVTYSGNIGIQNATKLVERLSSAEHATFLNQALTSAGKTARWTDDEITAFRTGSDPYKYPNTDWYDLAYKTGVQHQHSFNVSGGTDDIKYMASAGYMYQNGILPHSNRERFNGRTNLDFKFSSRLEGHIGLAYINNDYDDPTSSYAGGSSDQIIRQLNIIAPWIVSRYADGTYGTVSDGNPLAWLDANQVVRRENKNFTGTLGLDYKILPELVLSAKGAYVSSTQHYRNFQKFIQYNASKASEPNFLDERHYDWTRKTFDLLLNYEKKFDKHGLKGLAGWNAEAYDYYDMGGKRKNFPNNELTDMDAGDASTTTNLGKSRELNMVSWFGRINYDYDDKYLFEANIRADASSRFAKGHRWGYFPSMSAAWRISSEPFMESTKSWLDYLKIRGSWGLLGNQEALDDYYPTINTYNLDVNYAFGGSLVPGYYQKNFKINTISWEKARTIGFGVDFTIFKKLTGTIDYYDRKTTGIIMDVAVPYEFQLNAYKDNVGAMSNRGIELSLAYRDQWGDWTFGAMANFSYNKNKILDLGGDPFMADPNNSNMRRQVGKAINSYYMYRANGFFASDADAQAWMDKYKSQAGYPFGSQQFKAGDLIYEDANNDGKMSADDRVFCNSTNPAFNFGLTLNAGWRNFDFQAMFTGFAKAARILSAEVFGDFRGDNSHPATIWRKSWTFAGQDAEMPRIFDATNSPSHPQRVMSTFWLQNTSHIRLKNIQIGYTLPESWVKAAGLTSVRFYYSAENLFTIDKMPVNIDPETTVERGSNYPLIMTNSFGVNITF